MINIKKNSQKVSYDSNYEQVVNFIDRLYLLYILAELDLKNHSLGYC